MKMVAAEMLATDLPLTSTLPSRLLYIIDAVSSTFFGRVRTLQVSPIFPSTLDSLLSLGDEILTLCCHFLRLFIWFATSELIDFPLKSLVLIEISVVIPKSC